MEKFKQLWDNRADLKSATPEIYKQSKFHQIMSDVMSDPNYFKFYTKSGNRVLISALCLIAKVDEFFTYQETDIEDYVFSDTPVSPDGKAHIDKGKFIYTIGGVKGVADKRIFDTIMDRESNPNIEVMSIGIPKFDRLKEFHFAAHSLATGEYVVYF